MKNQYKYYKNYKQYNKYSGFAGFTLVELMVVIVLMGIMAAFAYPSMSSFVENSRLTNRTEQLANLFRYAKAEAVRLNAPVVICGVSIRSDGRHDGNCVNSGVDTNGWLAYGDINRNGKYEEGKDTDLRTVSLNGVKDNEKKVNLSVDLYNISGQKIDTQSSQFMFMPNGTFGRKPNKDNYGGMAIGDSYVRFTATDALNNKRTRYLVITPSGTANVCAAQNTKSATSGTQNTRVAVGCDFK